MLIKCPECKKEISDKTKVCFHCGYSFETYKTEQIQEKHENNQKLSFDHSSKCPVCNNKQWKYDDSKTYIKCQVCGYAANICIDLEDKKQQMTDSDYNSKCPACGTQNWKHDDSGDISCSKCGYVAAIKYETQDTKKITLTIPEMVKELEKISFFNKFGLKQTPEVVDYVKEYFQCSANIANSVLKTYREQYYNIYEHNYITKAESKATTILNQPKCPTCQSTNIRKIGTIEGAVSILGLGLLSRKINKTWKCNNCGHTW